MNRWTDETEELVALAIHVADCEASWWEECRPWKAHRRAVHEVLAKLADAGLLVPPGSPPWPRPSGRATAEIPADVRIVMDRHGETWRREPELPGAPPSPRDTWVSAVGNRFHWYGLVGIRGPLTEPDGSTE